MTIRKMMVPVAAANSPMTTNSIVRLNGLAGSPATLVITSLSGTVEVFSLSLAIYTIESVIGIDGSMSSRGRITGSSAATSWIGAIVRRFVLAANLSSLEMLGSVSRVVVSNSIVLIV